MSKIEVFCIDNCPNCKKLCMMLDRANIEYGHFNLDQSTDDLAEAAFRGIMSEPFPVVFINDRKLQASTPLEYFEEIKKA